MRGGQRERRGKREGGWEMEEGEGGGMCQWMVVDRGEGHTKCQ